MAEKKEAKKVTKSQGVKESKVAVPKVVVKPAAKAVATPKSPTTKTSGLSVPVYSLLGREAGTLALPKEVFGVKVNERLLAQALRVYTNNTKGHFSNTKTRGEVEGSSRKIYKQKGTGRARHGTIRANIFVGGGIALGPKSRNVVLDLPKKMKRAALVSALSQKVLQSGVVSVSGLDKATGKTKEMAKLVGKMGKKSVLIVADKRLSSAERAVRNLEKVEFTTADGLNAFEVIRYQSLVLTKEAVDALHQRVRGAKEPVSQKGKKDA